MDADTFYRRFVEITTLPPDERHQALSDLHTDVARRYLTALRAITPVGATCMVPDGRTVAQVVGHIVEWERYTLISAGELLAGVEWPGLLSHARYVESDGGEFAFLTNAEFNARQVEKYAARPWEEVLALAIETATTCHQLWTQSGLLGSVAPAWAP